jgi:hypothetical protein
MGRSLTDDHYLRCDDYECMYKQPGLAVLCGQRQLRVIPMNKGCGCGSYLGRLRDAQHNDVGKG